MRNRTTFTTLITAIGMLAWGCAEEKPAEPKDTTQSDTKDMPDMPDVPDEAKTADKPDKPAVQLPAAAEIPPPPLGLPETPAPKDNPDTADKVALGELLFFDTRLSDKGEFACVTCHLPEKGWTDGKALSEKHNGKLNSRHSPTLYNVAYAQQWYWDGRKATLEDQILAAWIGQVGATPDDIAKKLAQVPTYNAHFQRAFGEPPSKDNIAKALASFVRIKIRSGNSAWDRYQAGDKKALSKDAIKGFAIFAKKTTCPACHAPPLFTDMNYHNVGIGYVGKGKPDVGRFAVTKTKANTGAFKTPTLRGLTATAPYFHDGSVATLDEAVDFMLKGGHKKGNKYIDPLLKKVKLNKKERKRLMAFIKSLSPDENYTPPELP
ncbi:MAG: c-type cytochrome [Proteobacteria bacterium]|nr:c-type cytochrome [Pseudomonadota bacterium]